MKPALVLVLFLQAMLTDVPVPSETRLQLAASTYQQQHAACYYADLLRAHAALGLLRQIRIPALHNPSLAAVDDEQHVAWGFASIAPYKDMEVCVVGRHICCPAFQKMLHAALRALIDGLGCRMFNVGALNINLEAQPPAGVGLDRHFWRSSCEEANGSSSSSIVDKSSSDDLPHSGSQAAVKASAATSSGVHGTVNSSANLSVCSWHYTGNEADMSIPEVLSSEGHAPVVARLVSRGKLSAASIVTSDFGGLEVFGGASIGHTDPYLVVQHLDMQLTQQYSSTQHLN